MTATGTMLTEWRSYERDVVPAEAGDAQREECRRAFYAGAWACFVALLAAAEPDDEAECEFRIEELQWEIQNAPQDPAITRTDS